MSKILHIRRLADFGQAGDDWLDEQVTAAQDLFNTAGLAVTVASDEMLPFAEGIVHIEECQLNAAGTPEQSGLYYSVPDVPATDLVVFIVRDFRGWKGGGCAWHPPGRPGCMVKAGAVGAARWKLAHEVGHVLGLLHQKWSTMLRMPRCFGPEIRRHFRPRKLPSFLAGLHPPQRTTDQSR